ncbi:hypothetical protein [Actinomadura hibisca]|uniref:hypothetical protein n=1 Tax=Actinomadura hibisca TaxID=68565 RepID=UPI00082B30EA|nr:hypothetical protein [Actinomadura hibisca]
MAERRVPRALAPLVLGVLLTTLTVAVDGAVSDRTTISRSTQPTPDTYTDKATYSAALVEVHTLLLRRHRPYELWITHRESPDYGHRVQLDGIAPGGGKPRITAAEWRPEGVRVHFASGHQTFVPARWFLGGR